MKQDWLWDKNIDAKDAKAVFSDKNNSRFISYAGLLLSRKNSAQEVFKEFIKKEDFFVCWHRIKKQMRRNAWNDPRIEYWQAIYETLKKIPELAELKQEKFDEPIYTIFGEISAKIKEAREKKGLTQKKLAQKLGVSQQIISRIEKGKHNISLKTLNNVCQNLGIALNAEKLGFKKKPNITITRRILPFSILQSNEFEELCYWIVERSSMFDKTEHYGGMGDKQRDIIGYKYNTVGRREKWYFQCKNYNKINLLTFKNELDLIKKHSDASKDFKPDNIVFVTGCPVSPNCKDETKKYGIELSFESIIFWTDVELNEKANATEGVVEYFFQGGINVEKIGCKVADEVKKITNKFPTIITEKVAEKVVEKVDTRLTEIFQQYSQVALPDPVKKNKINAEIDEAVKLINKNDFKSARERLFFILGKTKDKPNDYANELARAYNNLGVCFNILKNEGGDFDKAEEYFKLALKSDPNFKKALANIAAAYLGKGGKENFKKAYDIAYDLWEKSKKKEPYIFNVFIWSISYHKSVEEAIAYYEKKREVQTLVKDNEQSLNIMGRLYLETQDFKKAEEFAELALEISPNSAQNLLLKARVILGRCQKKNIIPSDFEVVPRFRDYQDIKKAFQLLDQALKVLKNKNNRFLETEIIADMLHCYLWLRLTDDPKYMDLRNSIDTSYLSQYQLKQLRIQDSIVEFQRRNFETAYTKLTQYPEWPKMDYQEKTRIAQIFSLHGAPEQSKEILKLLETEAEQKKDEYLWLYMSNNEVLLYNKNLAIKAAQKAKDFSTGTEMEKEVSSYFNALMLRYAYSGEVDRLMAGLFDYNKKYPDDRIIRQIKAINEDKTPTEEFKSILSEQKEWYEGLRQMFRSQPAISYQLEEIFKRPYADILSMQNDPDFIIELTFPDKLFEKELTENLEKTENIVFDYASLLNLSKMNLLGHLEKFGKHLFITEKLFLKVQTELIMFEQEDLRRLWNFLRKSKEIHFIEESKAQLKEDVSDLFDPWIIDSMKTAKEKNAVFVTDDLRLLNYLQSEQDIKGCNSFIILRNMLLKDWIDAKIYATSVGDLAERFYVFLPFSGDDLFQIVMEDKSKVTLRSFHLVRQLSLPGSIAASFIGVFVRFIDLLWRTGSLPEDKVRWLTFLTQKILDFFIDKHFDIQNTKELEKIVPNFVNMWIIAVQRSNRDEITLLKKKVGEVFSRPYLATLKENLTKLIETKIVQIFK